MTDRTGSTLTFIFKPAQHRHHEVGPPLVTGRIKRCQLTAAHRHKLRREPAMAVDPGADFGG